ncbi:MAG: hypothetical protein RLZZ265_2743 [Verrucomicrobiota bacterium]
MHIVKVGFDPTALAEVDREAHAAGLSRAELIRQRTLTRGISTKELTPSDYHRLVSEAAAFTRGALDRRELEALVAFTISKLAA